MQRDFLSILISCFMYLCVGIVCSVFCIVLGFIFFRGVPYLSLDLFAFQYTTSNLSMLPAIINTFCIVLCSLLLAMPLGIFGAVFLSEYANKKSKMLSLITLACETLSGIPSIVYGLFGYLAFVIYFGLKISFLSGVLTLSIMVLPLILRSSEEALKAVSDSLREASFALGATKLRTIFCIVLPAAIPGILTGIILSIGKIVGESAALLYTAGSVAQIAGFLESGRTLSVHMYALSSEGLHTNQAYATASVLVLFILGINLLSNFIASKLTKDTK
ncbi:MAG: phosphate ABC transporter permease PstA [Helicobacter sp.]|nr:phosphate ABC transporter permease PstA [Helicobacter sp.]